MKTITLIACIFVMLSSFDYIKLIGINKIEYPILILFFGFYPDPLFKTIDISISELIRNYEMNLTYYLTEAAK